MKKSLFLLLAGVLASLCLFSITASAERTIYTPVTLCENYAYGGDLFTITEVRTYDTCLSDKTLYKKYLDIDVFGYFAGSIYSTGAMDLTLFCYDTSGNHIDTQYFKVESTDYSGSLYEYGSYHSFEVPDITASFEIAASYPGSWSNTLFKNDYCNVWSSDGRVLAIPSLMLPIYESVGWHGNVKLWSLNGDRIEVPYPQVAAYKSAGWYEGIEYDIILFRQEYQKAMANGDYESIMTFAENLLYSLEGTAYEQELYVAKTQAMDALRASINGPLYVGYDYVYPDSDSSYITNIEINLRNVSYKPIIAFKLRFSCYDVFGNVEVSNDIYYADDIWLNSGETNYYIWEEYNTDIEYISKPIVTQVVYSDYTSWYR